MNFITRFDFEQRQQHFASLSRFYSQVGNKKAGLTIRWGIQSFTVDDLLINRRETLARGALINLIGKLFGRAVHIGSQVVLARWLGPVLFGLYAIGWNLLRVGTSILPFGIDISLLQMGPGLWPKNRKKISQLFQTAGLIIAAISLLAGFSLFIGADWISDLYSKPELALVIRLLAIALPLALLLRVAAYATRVTQNMQYGIVSEEIIQPIVNLALAIAFLIIGLGLFGALWATNLSFAAALIYTIFMIGKIFPGVKPIGIYLDKRIFTKLWAASTPIAIAAVFTTLILLVDRLLVGFILSEKEAGIYQAASIFAVFFVTVLSAFKTIVAPMVSAAFDRKDQKGIMESFKISTRWGIYLSIPVAAVLIAAPGPTLEVLFGAEYAIGSAALTALTLGQLANVFSGPVEYYLIMTGSAKTWTWINAIMLAMNIVLNLILIPRLGILGAGISAAVTFAATSLISLLAVRRKLGISPYDAAYLRGFIATIAMTVGLIVIGMLPVDPVWLKLLVIVIGAPTIFFLMLWFLGIDPAEKRLFAAVLSRSKR